MTTPLDVARPRPSLPQVLAALMGLAGIFLPFAGGYSAFTALKQGFAPSLAAAAFLSPLITFMALRFLSRGSLTAVEYGLGWLVSAIFLCLYLWGWYLTLAASTDWSSTVWGSLPSAIVLFLPLLLLGLGIGITVRSARHATMRSAAPILALRTMYVVNAAFGLSAFFGGWQVGAWAILVAALIHLYLMSLALGRTS